METMAVLGFIFGFGLGVFGCAWQLREQCGGVMKALLTILRGGGPGEEGS